MFNLFRSKFRKRSQAEIKEDEEFMLALKEIKTLKADKMYMSMDSSDLKEQIEELHEIGQRLTKGSY